MIEPALAPLASERAALHRDFELAHVCFSVTQVRDLRVISATISA